MEIVARGESTSMSVFEAMDFSPDDEAGIDILICIERYGDVIPQRVGSKGVPPIGSEGSGSAADRYPYDGSKQRVEVARQLAREDQISSGICYAQRSMR